MVLLWLLSLKLRDASIVDIWWGPGIAVLTVAAALGAGSDGAGPRRLITLAAVGLWAGRLAWHIGRRNLGVKREEDVRYAAWRAKHGGRWWWRSLFQVFLLQGVIAWVVALPVMIAVSEPSSGMGVLDVVGAAVFLLGLGTEAVADRQLARHIADPANKGRLLDSGLWRYSRHPNYFGEALLWWGLGILGAAAGAWWSLAGPLVITLFLRFGSGVPLTERRQSPKPGWDEYAARTNAFVPWPPRRSPPTGQA